MKRVQFPSNRYQTSSQRGDGGMGKPAKSCRNPLQGVPFDPFRFKAIMPDRWTQFLRANHQSAEEVQYFYGVSARTAEYWWNGCTHAPSGHIVALAAVSFPQSFQKYFKEAA